MSFVKLDPCPFCGGQAGFERMGNPRQSCIVVCEDCGCKLETNESWIHSGKKWNERFLLKTAEGEQK